MKMDRKTYVALKKSIATWRRRESGQSIQTGTVTCALCQLFHCDHRKDGQMCCAGCPVFVRTKKRCCSGTPYAAYSCIRAIHSSDSAPAMSAAMGERLFLETLLPAKPPTK